ncbi:MAG: hypothetical protein JNK48_17580 [Bryobacterales bacterium]|nr:hypothetical protein [Bryobacterales bacterium]
MTDWKRQRQESGDAADFRAAHHHHYEECVKFKPGAATLPEYLRPAWNDNNRSMPASTKLLSVVDLNDAFKSIRHASTRLRNKLVRSSQESEFLDILSKLDKNPRAFGVSLDSFFRRKAKRPPFPPQVERQLRALVYALDSYTVDNGGPPCWATTASAFEAYRTEKPESWLQLLGMRPRPECWLAVFAYEVPSRHFVARPSILEAPSYSHFPSSPSDSAGRTMELSVRAAGRNCVPLPEYIHRPLPFGFDTVIQIGRTAKFVQPTRDKLKKQLRKHRVAHWKRLQQFTPWDGEWFDEGEAEQPCR